MISIIRKPRPPENYLVSLWLRRGPWGWSRGTSSRRPRRKMSMAPMLFVEIDVCRPCWMLTWMALFATRTYLEVDGKPTIWLACHEKTYILSWLSVTSIRIVCIAWILNFPRDSLKTPSQPLLRPSSSFCGGHEEYGDGPGEEARGLGFEGVWLVSWFVGWLVGWCLLGIWLIGRLGFWLVSHLCSQGVFWRQAQATPRRGLGQGGVLFFFDLSQLGRFFVGHFTVNKVVRIPIHAEAIFAAQPLSLPS